MFNFSNSKPVEDHLKTEDLIKKFVSMLPEVGVGTGYGLPQTRKISLAPPKTLFRLSNMTKRWQIRDICNFEYIMFLNTISGRTYQDLNQYPVFPWILSDYTSESLDLKDPKVYRDLSKPIGALNLARAAYFQKRFEDWDDPNIPPFHYGTHYSTASFTLSWLVRVEPFTTLFLALQDGKFDHPDRTFSSIQQAWRNCQRDSHDVKELIPEFFYLPEMFRNENQYNFGRQTETNKVINHVELPPWSDNSAEKFVRINRQALESNYVSEKLCEWIDLVFGYKQRGENALHACNVFYYLTYDGAIDLSSIENKVDKDAIQEQIKHFGQTPSQLLHEPHPKRSLDSVIDGVHSSSTVALPEEQDPNAGIMQSEVLMVLKFQSNSPVCYVAANTHYALDNPSIVTVTQNQLFGINKWRQDEIEQARQEQNSADANTRNRRGNRIPEFPIEEDPMIKLKTTTNKRMIPELLDQSHTIDSKTFLVAADNSYIFVCGFWDRSFRIYNTEDGSLHQTVFGHCDIVTLLCRSETYIGGDCYIISGSRDGTLMLWYWNGRKHQIIGDSPRLDDNPSPRAFLTGHNGAISAASICAELGLIASASNSTDNTGEILLHTITGSLLRKLRIGSDIPLSLNAIVEHLDFSNEGFVVSCYSDGTFISWSINGKIISHNRVIDDKINAIAMSNDGQYLAFGGRKGEVKVWDAFNLKPVSKFPQCDTAIRDLSLTHDQKYIITAMQSGSIVAFRIDFKKIKGERIVNSNSASQ